MKLACASCHTGVTKEERAGFPAEKQCRACHTDAAWTAPEIPSRRVYEVADFVNFSHARHLDAKVECQRCHGSVYERDVLKLEWKPTMKACMDCHREGRATLACNACHELGQ